LAIAKLESVFLWGWRQPLAANQGLTGYMGYIGSGIVHAIPLAVSYWVHPISSPESFQSIPIEISWQQPTQSPVSSEVLPPILPDSPQRQDVKSHPKSPTKEKKVKAAEPVKKPIVSQLAEKPEGQSTDSFISPQPDRPPEPCGEEAGSPFNAPANRKPHYPEEARLLGIEGTVMLEITLSPQGHVVSVRALGPRAHPLLEDSALKQIKSWRFPPSLTKRSLKVPVKFELR
jgi:periplasmic protein TonB